MPVRSGFGGRAQTIGQRRPRARRRL